MAKFQIAIVVFFQLVISSVYAAGEFPVQGRFFLGSTTIEPKDFNTVVEGEGLAKYDKLNYLGVEITYPVLGFLNVGGRYHRRSARANVAGSTFDTDNHALITQDSVLFLARGTVFSSPIFKIDIFGGVGSSTTKFKIKTGSQDGELTKAPATENGFGSLLTSYGVSALVGYSWIYLFVEGGIEQNKISGFDRKGTVSNSFQELDMSGPYIMVGLMLDGLKGSNKK